ncbi:hypothetical protein P9D14_12775 [Bacillus velezensis]|uniref:hypothetical protein n=1 Tax=Bacillus velezensis TaxID=492670 RepID=UPI002DB981FD|nr:hypothetical protein [Bacillus velezensis]MEC1384390.1 hypothetical protein [Bacillus velezensis]
MVRMNLTQVSDNYGSTLDNREVPPEEVANVLKEYANHPNQSEYFGRELLVSFNKDGDILVALYNGYIE